MCKKKPLHDLKMDNKVIPFTKRWNVSLEIFDYETLFLKSQKFIPGIDLKLYVILALFYTWYWLFITRIIFAGKNSSSYAKSKIGNGGNTEGKQ